MGTDWKKEAEYLQQQLDDERYNREQQQEREYQEREEARRQRHQEMLEAQCYADSWSEAFQKAIPRLAKEANMEIADNYPDDHFFRDELEQHQFAQQVWREEEKAIQERIHSIRERAERLIAALEQSARDKAADRVEEKYPDAAIAENLRNDDFNALVNW